VIPFFGSLPWLLPASLVALVVSIATSAGIGRWLGTRRGVAWVLVITLGIILSATLSPLGRPAAEGIGAGTCDLGRIRPAAAADLFNPTDVIVNILMFVPLGFAVGLVPGSRRKLALLGGVLVLPIAVEATQLLVTPLHRACESADVVDNLSGLVIGLVAGTSLGRIVPSIGRPVPRRPGSAR
jgi:hypothetical protein